MSNIRILNLNLSLPGITNGETYSSQQSSYPESNVYNFQRRGKVWRTNGFWRVLAGSNTLVFNEGAADLTATVAAADYTSTTTFLAAVKAALDGAPGATKTYTVAQDGTTKRIKITPSAGIFAIRNTDPGSLAMCTTMGYQTTAATGLTTPVMADILKIHTSEWIRWDLGASSNPKGFVLIGGRNTGIKLSPGAVIRLQGNETDIWDTPSYQATVAWDPFAICQFSDTGLHTEALRYWRMEIVDASNPLGYLEAGTIFLGDAFIPTRGCIQFPLTAPFQDKSATVYSENGQSFSDIRPKTQAFDMQFGFLTKTENEIMDDFAEKFGTSLPFFISLDPNVVFGSSENYHVKLVKLVKDLAPRLISPNVFSMDISVREEI